MSSAAPTRGSRPVGRSLPNRATLRRGLRVIGTGIREQPKWFSVALVGAVLYALMTVGTAWAIGHLTKTVVRPAIDAGEVDTDGLWYAGWLLGGIVLLNVVGVITRRIAAGVAGYNLQARYRRRVTRQYLRLPLSWHHRHPSGQLLSNANADIEATWQNFNPLPMAIGVLVMLVVAGVQMVLVDPVLAFIGLLVFPALFAANLAFQRVMSPRITKAQQLRAEVSEVAHESFDAGLVVKAMGREEQETGRFRTVTHQLRDSLIHVGRTRGVFDPVIEAIPTLGTLAVLAVGTARVSSGDIGAAEVAQVAYLFSILAFPVRALGWVLAEIPRSVVGWNRIRGVLDATGSMPYGDLTLPRGGASHARTEHAAYTYADRGEHEHLGAEQQPARDADGNDEPDEHRSEPNPAVSDVSLDVPAGSTTAVVGPTGSGKSTLASLMLRLIDPDTGVVTLDGVDLSQVRKGEIPQVGSLVSQQTFMFDETVRGNVTLGLERTDEQVWQALRVAQADGFVRGLSQDLQTPVGERGGTLSGGQRQRIALARAITRRPQLLVLDDATSAVDPGVEQAILAALRESSGSSAGITVVVVAYRMATIMLADTIIYVEQGRVVDQGRHDELIGRCTGYAELVTAYAREAAERAAVEADEEAP